MANKPPGKVRDPQIDIVEDRELIRLSLLDLVANGRLYIKSNNGEMIQVAQVTYWDDDNIMSTCSDGYEYDENGTKTRIWR